MIVFRHSGGELPFKSYLTKLVVDDPEQKNDDGVDLFSMAVGALRLAMSDTGLDIPIERRTCSAECNCKESYAAEPQHALAMFDAKI